MPKDCRNSIVLQMALDLERRIHHNFFDPDHPLPSLKDICRIQQISYMTAYRIYDELARKGIIYSINGKGFFINKDYIWNKTQISLPPLEEVVTFVAGRPEEKEDRLIKGIQNRANERGISFRKISVSSEFKLGNASGIVMRYNSSFLRLYQKLGFRCLRVVLTNNYFPQIHCIIHDNFDAMQKILDHLKSRNCRKIIYCGGHFTDLGQANLNEREYAFSLESERHSIVSTLLLSGNLEDVLEVCRDPSRCPDAIIFGTNTSAVNFADRIRNIPAFRKIRLVVFESFMRSAAATDTWIFSGERLGRAAVDVLIENSPEDWMLPSVRRIKGNWSQDPI